MCVINSEIILGILVVIEFETHKLNRHLLSLEVEKENINTTHSVYKYDLSSHYSCIDQIN